MSIKCQCTVGELAERSLPIPEVRGSNRVMGKISNLTYLKLTVDKTKIKKKEAGIGPFLRTANELLLTYLSAPIRFYLSEKKSIGQNVIEKS